jgi:hypothetical protein
MSDDAIVSLLEELVNWTRFAHRDALVKTLRDVLADPRHFNAYAKSDGTRGQAEIGQSCDLSQATVSRLWTKWRRLGIAREIGGRTRHLIDPEDLGLEAPASAGSVKTELTT